jgi:putative phosphoribosyl transferase
MIFESISSKFQVKLKDRVTAGSILGEALKDVIKKEQERKGSIVLGIPRGGVIVGDIIAKKLSCKFDIIIPRKLCAPHNEELAIGAVMEDGTTTYLNDILVKELEISQEYIEKEKAYQIQEIRRRSSLYRNSEREYEFKNNNKYIILADDGAATGATVIAAARWIIKKKKTEYPTNRLIIAIPVVPKQTKDLLKKEADHIEVITSPSTSNFRSVGQYYQSFEPITDEKVIEIMKRNRG